MHMHMAAISPAEQIERFSWELVLVGQHQPQIWHEHEQLSPIHHQQWANAQVQTNMKTSVQLNSYQLQHITQIGKTSRVSRKCGQQYLFQPVITCFSRRRDVCLCVVCVGVCAHVGVPTLTLTQIIIEMLHVGMPCHAMPYVGHSFLCCLQL